MKQEERRKNVEKKYDTVNYIETFCHTHQWQVNLENCTAQNFIQATNLNVCTCVYKYFFFVTYCFLH